MPQGRRPPAMDLHNRGSYSARMNVLALPIAAEIPEDDAAIERLHERSFGPGRYARTAFRIREGRRHLLPVSFTAHIGTLLVGSVRLTPVTIGTIPALLLRPLTVAPPFRSHGIGRKLLERALADSKKQGHKLVFLVGDEPYYGRVGFKRVPKRQVTMPGPVDPGRLLVAELEPNAFAGVAGTVLPDWETTTS